MGKLFTKIINYLRLTEEEGIDEEEEDESKFELFLEGFVMEPDRYL